MRKLLALALVSQLAACTIALPMIGAISAQNRNNEREAEARAAGKDRPPPPPADDADDDDDSQPESVGGAVLKGLVVGALLDAAMIFAVASVVPNPVVGGPDH